MDSRIVRALEAQPPELSTVGVAMRQAWESYTFVPPELGSSDDAVAEAKAHKALTPDIIDHVDRALALLESGLPL